MQSVPRTFQHKGFQVLAINQKIVRIPFSKIASAAALLLAQSVHSADVPFTPEQQKKYVREHRAHLKAETIAVAKTAASEQQFTCRREFSESLADALAKAKEQRRKLLLEIVECASRRPRTAL